MRRKLLPALFSLCFIFLFAQITLAKKEEMKLLLNKGQHYIYLITQENTMEEISDKSDKSDKIEMKQNMALKIDHKVIDQLPNGNYLIEASFKSFGIELNSDGKISRYHSDTIDVMNSMYKTLNFLTSVKLKYEVSREGVVSNLSGFESIREKMTPDRKLLGLLRSFGNERFILEMYNYVPTGNVGVGDKWTKSAILPDLKDLKYDIQYSMKEASTQNLKLIQNASFSYSTELPMGSDVESKMDGKGTQNGFLLINPITKMRISSDINQQIELSIQKKGKEQTKKIPPRRITTHTTMVLVKK
jgi:hypothetical protein